MTHTPDRAPRTAPRKAPRKAATTVAIAAAALLLLSAAPLAAQTEDFDLDRAWIAEPGMIDPFLVDQVKPLAAALDAREIEKSTWLLVVQHPAGRLALVTDQLSYHHVAQGSIRGEPWMVSF